MSQDSASIDNPFAPPRATVADQPGPSGTTELAGRGARLGAAIIDGLPFVLVGIVAALLVPVFHRSGLGFHGAGPVLLALAGIGTVAWLVINAVMAWRFGQTVGKRLAGIRVVRQDGSRISFGRLLLLRNVVPALIGLVPVAGKLFGLVDALWIFGDARRCLHDLIADSMVVTAASSTHATLRGSRPE